MITKYKMHILGKEKTHQYPLRVLPMYEWDTVLGFMQNESVQKLSEVKYLREITNLMIKPGFLDEFYLILDDNREFSTYYKDYLIAIIYSVQFNTFHLDTDFKKPSFIFLKEYQNNVGDFVVFDYINDEEFNYEYVINNIKNTDQICA
ncbi:Hypothetical protein BOM_1416 (plasmid) [Borrelia miyamotoi FR64b]|uniref:Uncharacterized protein n=1 Tax=Borrelia miyamotoi FR64b TaxID=1292392 RepID=W5SFU2_9SPIR|nr:DUF1473 family protein [Borrelia miyamotoi]AHH05959.1 Hypothetical protein BOM_1416 [Borrelia miyamotoi FR64b]WAZ71276.1 DUF1473 family protein [Borrelia miyamotoi]